MHSQVVESAEPALTEAEPPAPGVLDAWLEARVQHQEEALTRAPEKPPADQDEPEEPPAPAPASAVERDEAPQEPEAVVAVETSSLALDQLAGDGIMPSQTSEGDQPPSAEAEPAQEGERAGEFQALLDGGVAPAGPEVAGEEPAVTALAEELLAGATPPGKEAAGPETGEQPVPATPEIEPPAAERPIAAASAGEVPAAEDERDGLLPADGEAILRVRSGPRVGAEFSGKTTLAGASGIYCLIEHFDLPVGTHVRLTLIAPRMNDQLDLANAVVKGVRKAPGDTTEVHLVFAERPEVKEFVARHFGEKPSRFSLLDRLRAKHNHAG